MAAPTPHVLRLKPGLQKRPKHLGWWIVSMIFSIIVATYDYIHQNLVHIFNIHLIVVYLTIMIIFNSLVFYSVLQALIIASTPPAFIAVLSQARLIADAQQQERDQDAWPWIKRMRFGKRNYLRELTYPLKRHFWVGAFPFPKMG